ncbi:MAG: hypothetical protein MZV64_64425 [Ignavibacteriales bacterium]|nr:hypothetical protein [Ignavibacteriales bacterium]
MKVGDKFVLYITKIFKFGAMGRITGDFFEDCSKLWIDSREIYPSRRPITMDFILECDRYLDVRQLVPVLSFIKSKRKWGAQFQNSIIEIEPEDYKLIESKMIKNRESNI